jgi:hypothetical protein
MLRQPTRLEREEGESDTYGRVKVQVDCWILARADQRPHRQRSQLAPKAPSGSTARRVSKDHGKKVVTVAAAIAFVATIMMESRAIPKRSTLKGNRVEKIGDHRRGDLQPDLARLAQRD